MFFSLNGWLHDLGDSYLFSGHMVQHLMLAFVVAPLLIMGTPGEMLRPLLQYRAVRAVAVWITAPIRCFAIFNIVVAGWHLPPLYNYALAHHPAHIVQHLMFLAASVLMWWPVLSPMPELPRLSYPGQMLYLFLLSIPMAIVSVYISYCGHDSLSDVRERPADLGNFADERSDDRWTDHVDSRRAVFLHDHLDRLLPLAATKRRRKPVGGSGGLAGGVVVVIPRCPSG
jgi:putative membrane protein